MAVYYLKLNGGQNQNWPLGISTYSLLGIVSVLKVLALKYCYCFEGLSI